MELVVLVDEQNNILGTAPKDTVHTKNTPLHRAFSLFLFNSNKELLLTKRASTKKTFSDIWTNTVCGHVGPDESTIDAVRRRLKEELRLEGMDMKEVAPYRYRFADQNGVVENEICPIFVAFSDLDPKPNPEEVGDWKWMDWEKFLQEIKIHPTIYSPWCIEGARLVKSFL